MCKTNKETAEIRYQNQIKRSELYLTAKKRVKSQDEINPKIESRLKRVWGKIAVWIFVLICVAILFVIPIILGIIGSLFVFKYILKKSSRRKLPEVAMSSR